MRRDLCFLSPLISCCCCSCITSVVSSRRGLFTLARKGNMSSNNRALKIVMCGPVKGGKTSIANFMAGQTEQIGTANKIYEPTVGVRILECEKQPGITGNKVPVEIWDVSGDQAFESCWPAIMKGVDGVMLVYNPEIPSHDIEVGIWFDQFVKRPKLDNRQCQVIAHRASPTPALRSRLPPKLASLSGNILHTNFASVSQVITGFEDFLREVHQASMTQLRK